MMGRGGGRDRLDSEYTPRFEDKERRSGWGVAPPSRHLWVGNLSPHVTLNTLSEQFLRFGDVENIAYVPGRSYAFVNYKKEEDAVIALRGLQGFIVAGNPLRIEFAKGDRTSMLSQDEDFPQYSDQRHSMEQGEPLFRRDLRPQHLSPEKPYEKFKGNRSAEPSEVLWIGFPTYLKVDEVLLRRAFSPFGEIENITTFPGRSYAFVRYRSVVAACRAKEALQGKLFNNPRVSICFAKSDLASAEHGRSSTNGPFPHFKPNFQPGLSGQGVDTFQRDRSFDKPVGEFHMASPRFISDFDRMTGDSGVAGFGRNSSIRPGAGPRLNVGGAFEHIRLQEVGAERRTSEDPYEHHRSSPAGERIAPWLDIPFERARRTPLFEDTWGAEDGSFPLAKRLKTDSFPDKELPEYPFSDLEQEKHDPGPQKLFRDLPVHNNYNKTFNSVPFDHNEVPEYPRNPVRPLVQSDDSWRNFDSLGAGPGPLTLNTGKLQSLNKESHPSPLNEEWKWEGTIAKGGTPVCRARCFPVGKVLDFMLPEFLDCTARTGLDMLAKHYYQAASTWVVFFVAETDADIVFYNEFMHYLGEKQRAAVAKLGEGVTLFLVPPSDFSEQVLKVPGKVSISGVILKFQQPTSNFSSLHHPLEMTELKLPPHVPRSNDGVSFHEETSFRKTNSPDFRTSSQGQNYFNSSSGHLTPVTSSFPPPQKAGETLLFSGSAHPMGKRPDSQGDSRPDQLQRQNSPVPSNWSSHMRIPSGSAGNFKPPAPSAPLHSFDNFLGQYSSANPRVAQVATSSSYAPETSGISPLTATKLPPLQHETKPRPASSVPLPLQPEQLAQLAALLGQQKQPGKNPVLTTDGDKKHLNLSQNPSSHAHATVPNVQVSVPFGSSDPQISQLQRLKQLPSNMPAMQPTGNPGQQIHQAPSSSRDEAEADPQQRLQATLQLAAALLQQIQQQQSKTGDKQ